MKIFVKYVIKVTAFLLIFVIMLIHVVYLQRNISYGRNNVGGLSREESIDVICVGGSSTAVYWKPLLAWKEYGMTSYNYATDSFREPLMLGAIREIFAEQNPRLLVLDVRSFTSGIGDLNDSENGIRNMTDSMDFNFNRLNTVKDVMDFYGVDSSSDLALSYYFDVIKYHTNTEAFGSSDAWSHINNDCEADYKGFYFETRAYNEILSEPEGIQTEERSAIESNSEEYLVELLEYLNTKDVDVLFVMGPKIVDLETQKLSNYLGDIITSYGYNFINGNCYYEEMGLDFSKDFYNGGHLNAYGADKYTSFIADFIKDYYNIEDHSRDKLYYEKWNECYNSFIIRDNEIKAIIDETYNANLAALSE